MPRGRKKFKKVLRTKGEKMKPTPTRDNTEEIASVNLEDAMDDEEYEVVVKEEDPCPEDHASVLVYPSNSTVTAETPVLHQSKAIAPVPRELNTEGGVTVRSCVVRGCSVSGASPPLGFARVPFGEARFNIWIRLIGRRDLAGGAGRVYYVCENHFPPGAFITVDNQRGLAQYAVPTLKLPHPVEASSSEDPLEGTPSVNKVVPISLNAGKVAKKKGTKESGDSRKQKPTKENYLTVFHLLCEKLFSPQIARLLQAQADLRFKFEQSRSTSEFKYFCLYFYHASPSNYIALQKSFNLPKKKTLLAIHKAAATQGSEELMTTLKAKIQSMTDADRNCAVVIRQVQLKPHLYYHIAEDKLYGFAERHRRQSPEVASGGLLLAARGLAGPWTLPVDYALLNPGDTNAVSRWINYNINQLFEAGLNVRVCVSNLDSKIITLANGDKKNITIEKPFFHFYHSRENKERIMERKKVYYSYDPDYLLKTLYWCLMKHEFHSQGYVAKWEDILQFYNSDSKKVHRLVPELSERHVKPRNDDKMNSKLAVETLSERVAAGISNYIDFEQISLTAEGTVKLLMMISRLYKFMTSAKGCNSSEHQKPCYGNISQPRFAAEAQTFLKNLRIIQCGVDVTQDFQFIGQFQTSIRAIMLLWEDFTYENVPKLCTNYIRLNILENIIKQINDKSKTETVTAWKLISAYRKMLLKNMFKAPRNKPCPELISDIFQQYLQDSVKEDKPINSNTHFFHRIARLNLPVKMEDYKDFRIPDENQLVSISEFLLSKCLDKHSLCTLPKKNMGDVEYTMYENYVAEERRVKKPLALRPNDSLISTVQLMDVELEKNFNKYFDSHHLVAKIDYCSDMFAHYRTPCPCFPLVYMLKLYYRMRISHQLKLNNRRFRDPLEVLAFQFENFK